MIDHGTSSGPEVACSEVREALSAAIDGEDARMTGQQVDHHLEGCPDCARFGARAVIASRQVRREGMDAVPDLAPRIVAALDEDRSLAYDRRHFELRWIVAAAGVVQLVLALPSLMGPIGGDVHLGREVGALQLALGVGLILAAWQPRRAAGVLPIAAVVAAATAVTAVLDVITGSATAVGELTHLAELVGVAALWALTRGRDRDAAAGGSLPPRRRGRAPRSLTRPVGAG